MKGMKRTTLILVVLGAAVGGLVWWESRSGSDGKEKAREPVEIFPFLGEEVSKVDLVRGIETISVEKKDGIWRMTSPHDWPAGAEAMMIMLRGVDPAEKAYPLPAGEPPPAAPVHGLDSPALVVTLAAADGRKTSIAFGNPLGAGDKAFARRAGQNEVLTVSRAMLSAFDRTPESLRDTGFCRFDSKDMTSIAWSSGGTDVRVTRQGRGWRLAGSVEDLAEPGAVEDWALRISTATSATFAKRPKPSRADYGLEPAFSTIDVALKGKTVRVSIGAPVAEGEKRRWADTSEYPDDIGTMEEALVVLITPRMDALRSTRALPWPLDDVQAIAGTGAASFEVRKEAGAWTVVKPAVLTRFLPARVDQLLRQLAAAPVNGRHPAAPAPEGALHLALRFGKDAEAVEHSVDLWTDGTDTFFRTTDPERVVRELGTAAWTHASAGALYFRDPLVPTNITSPLQVKRISVTDRNNDVWVEAEFNGREWRQIGNPAGGKTLDSEKMSRFNQFWSAMEADTWVAAKRDAPEVGLAGSPQWKIRIIPDPARATNAVERVFLVGKDGPGNTMYAVLEGDEGVFLAHPHAAGMLRGGVWK